VAGTGAWYQGIPLVGCRYRCSRGYEADESVVEIAASGKLELEVPKGSIETPPATASPASRRRAAASKHAARMCTWLARALSLT
jgi:hypothetical protein